MLQASNIPLPVSSSSRCGRIGRPAMRQACSRRAVRVTAQQGGPTVGELAEKYSIKNAVQFMAGNEGLPKIQLKHNCGAAAEVYLFGACVTSWKQRSGDEVLYVRPDAVFNKSKPISGGLPHCFPQFGPGPMQQHGFARNLDWTVTSTSANPNPDDPEPSGSVGDQQVRHDSAGDLSDHNAGAMLLFQCLWLTYLDKSKDPKNPEKKVEERDTFGFGESLVDSVFLGAPEHLELDVGTGAAVAIDATGWEDAVVWNPHHTMKECYERFACVENAKFGTPAKVQPGGSWEATANFSVINIS
ncbi:galactose mutarotase-like domain-containing protein [Dunaliella salina]|uniref:Galactose mutarotase-like domain-containing protein n=1 Tax=Dunaliella salina TaxID=3046 RepID=A0ABQ7G286_DUNSA|nr:galactose mutarotase-like domain-containing protein [Dunaliella salina]|eukprot:KAF5828710.1 galactose mutarotase-like domain-containing protein [Dunaliella salina]